jgi:hypothetical protein
MIPFRLVLSLSVLGIFSTLVSAAPPDTTKADEETVKAAGLTVDDNALIQFFREKTLEDADRDKILKCIGDLGSDSFAVRESASNDLLKIGGKAASLLRQAMSNRDVEIARRAESCLDQLDKTQGPTITVAAARLLATRKPAATAQTLLKFAPFADDDYVLDTLRDTLTAVAVKDGKPEKALADALGDKLALRRSLAGESLVRAGQTEGLPALKKLLEDSDRTVRTKVGLAFVDKNDKSVIPGLIELLAELPRDESQPIEELLTRIAMDKSPQVPLGDDYGTRKKCRDAWKEWWSKNGDGIDLAKMDLGSRALGYTLIAGIDLNTGTGRVFELDKNGKVRWQITGLMQPMDAQVIANDRVLITDYRARKVTERNFKGEVIWEKATPNWPICAQRLANGNTVIFTRNQILEVDAGGKEATTITRKAAEIISGQKLKDGNYLITTHTGQILQLDSAGTEVKKTPAGIGLNIGSSVDVTPDGHYLVPNWQANVVNEIDTDAKVIKSFSVTQPTSVARLSNGGIVTGSMYTQQMTELDREGKKISESRLDNQVYRIRRR